MNMRICEVCKTENEAEYKFCKNCGNKLEDSQAEFYENKAEIRMEENPQETASEFNFGGVSGDELGAFVGKKQEELLPLFVKMTQSGRRVSWCWPGAILGFLLGPIGSAIWLFYRKMYKKAAIFSLLGVAVSFLVAVIDSTYVGAFDEFYAAFLKVQNEAEADKIIESLGSAFPYDSLIMIFISGSITSAASICSGIFTGLYGLYWYKNHCIEKISAYRMLQADPRYYKMGLSAIGGTSGGMLAVGIIVYYVVGVLSSYITEFLSVVFKL